MGVEIVLDDVDRRIVELLTFDGRASNRSLAAETGLTEATVGVRLRKLREQRVLHVTAVFDWWMLGYEWEAFLHIGVEGRSPRAVARELGALDAVHAMSLTLGSADLIVHVLAVDRDDLRRLVTDRVPAIPGVARLRTDVVLELASMTRVRAAMTPGESSTVDLTHARIDLDQLDRQLIDQLVDDGRRSNREIARQLDVSEGTIRSRLRRLEDARLLQVIGVADRTVMGANAEIAHVGIATEGPSVDDVLKEIETWPETMMCAVTTGPWQVQALIVTSEAGRLGYLVADRLHDLAGVRTTETWLNVERLAHRYHLTRFA